MKKLIVGAIASTAILASTMPAFAAADTLNWGTEVNPGECDKVGSPIVSVTQKIINTVDSGEGGNYWAFDDLNRHIQLWATNTADEYCAVVNYSGKFDAQAGETSPGAGGTLDGDEDGTFQGGYRATITGTPLVSPVWKTKGSVGTTDYQCDISGVCPGAVDWVEQYFGPAYGFAFDWWGWIYHAGKHGTWVNSSDGNSGDIL